MALRIFFISLLTFPIFRVMSQDCDVDFPGASVVNYASACGLPAVSNVTLGKNTFFGNGDVFTFNSNVDISGNLVVNAEGSGKIIIPAGVTVDLDGNFQLDTKNSACALLNPCFFEIEVQGTLIVSGNLVSKLTNLVWSGNGIVIAESNFEDRGCMSCALLGCPEFQVVPAKCKDEGNCLGNFCTAITTCLLDFTKPVITGCPSNIVTNMSGPGCTQAVTWTPPMANDNCAVTAFVASHSPGTEFPKGTTLVSYTASDAAGNSTTCTFNVTVVDAIAPVIASCPADISVNADASCQGVATWTAPTMTDNCTGGTLSSTHTPGSTFSTGTTPVTYTATDAAGNTATCTFNVTVADNIAPVITNCPSNISLSANASCQAVATWSPPVMTDNCAGGTLTTTHSPGSSFTTGTTIVTYTATDAAGNKATCSFNVTVSDNIAPVLTNCPSNITVNANASCQAVPIWAPPTIADNCPGATLTSTHTPGSNFLKGTTTVTYTATDASGNKASCSFNVTVIDNVPPTIANCPSNITVNADASCQAVASWTAPTMPDNCAGGTLTSTHSPGSTFSAGTTIVEYTATDAAGNKATCTFTVTVVDNAAPVITNCPADITVNANGSCQAIVTWTAPTISDNCGGATLTSTRAPGSTFNVGTTPVTYTATDGAGKTSTCTFNVIVADVTKPVISGCPSNITVNANASCQAVVTWTAPTISDNCSGATLASTRAPGSTFNVGITPVTYTATDAKGNSSTCTFNVIVQDTSKPVISGCPSNITVSANTSCQAVVSWTLPTVTDNCTGATITGSRSPGSTFNAGTTPVTYTARDAAGNTSTCTFNVIVQDAVKPVLSSCPSDISVSAGASCQAVVTWTPPGVTDNCTGVTLTGTHPPGSTFGIGTTPVSYTATDQAGNSSTCTFNVIVKDGSKPVLSGCPNDIVVNANTSCVAVADWVPPTATDNCSTTVSGTHTPGSTFAIGTTTVTYTATDAAGNSAQCTFSVIVKDTSVPVISGCPADITVVADASCQAVVSWIPPEFSDECSDGQITGTHNPGSAFEVGSTLVTYSAIDAAGNTASCSFTVNVESPDEAHFVDCPQNIVVENFSEGPIRVLWTAPVLSAPCGSADVTSNFSPGDEFEIGTTHVSYSGITQRGRTITCSFDVTVVFRGIIVHEVITPNGDGENDTWTIKNIENFPENNVVVFDRWGSVVYQASRYDGTSKTWAGSNVPAGTYYYTLIVKTADRNAEYKGFVELVK